MYLGDLGRIQATLCDRRRRNSEVSFLETTDCHQHHSFSKLVKIVNVGRLRTVRSGVKAFIEIL